MIKWCDVELMAKFNFDKLFEFKSGMSMYYLVRKVNEENIGLSKYVLNLMAHNSLITYMSVHEIIVNGCNYTSIIIPFLPFIKWHGYKRHHANNGFKIIQNTWYIFEENRFNKLYPTNESKLRYFNLYCLIINTLIEVDTYNTRLSMRNFGRMRLSLYKRFPFLRN